LSTVNSVEWQIEAALTLVFTGQKILHAAFALRRLMHLSSKVLPHVGEVAKKNGIANLQ